MLEFTTVYCSSPAKYPGLHKAKGQTDNRAPTVSVNICENYLRIVGMIEFFNFETMAKPANKTTETKSSVPAFLKTIPDENKRKDCIAIAELFSKATGFDPKMWGTAIVGFGSYHYKYESGREGDAPLTGFSPRANAIVLYLSANFEGRDELLKKFGKHKTGKGCIYIQKLEDVDKNVLTKMIKTSSKHIKSIYPD